MSPGCNVPFLEFSKAQDQLTFSYINSVINKSMKVKTRVVQLPAAGAIVTRSYNRAFESAMALGIISSRYVKEHEKVYEEHENVSKRNKRQHLAI